MYSKLASLPEWKEFADIVKDELDKIETEVNFDKICPPKDLIFSAFEKTPLSQIKVLILSQDPYHTPGVACGLAFSSFPGKPPPPSLQNIFRKLRLEGFSRVNNGDLSDWASQGVFLLNVTLTVEKSKPKSHAKIWEKFTDKLISYLDEKLSHTVWILWGRDAQCYRGFVDPSKNLLLEGTHPSPLSASRGFFDKDYFMPCNKFLESKGKTPINW